MPRPSRWMIRISLCYLMLGFTFGMLLLINKAVDIHPAIWILLPLHVETLFWGFIIQFTMGTAYWILPRYLEGAERGRTGLSWAMAGLLNLGILLYLAGTVTTVGTFFLITGRSLELVAVGMFVYLHWGRIATYRNN